MATLLFSIILVTGALLAVLAGWLLSRRPLERGCGKTPDQGKCTPGECEMCKKDTDDGTSSP